MGNNESVASPIFAARVGQILTSKIDGRLVQVELLGVVGRAYVYPVKRVNGYATVAGRSFWTTLHTSYWNLP